MSGPTPAQILETVEAERQVLINIVAAVQCVKAAASSGTTVGALQLVEEKLCDVTEGLMKEVLIRNSLAGQDRTEART